MRVIMLQLGSTENYDDSWISAGSGLWYVRESRYLNESRYLLDVPAVPVRERASWRAANISNKSAAGNYFLLIEAHLILPVVLRRSGWAYRLLQKCSYL